jgi:anti-anti-sigma factor
MVEHLEGDATAISVTVHHKADHVLVVVVGELDLSNVEVLSSCLDSLLAEEHPPRIVIEASELGFVDSTGLAALLKVAVSQHFVVLRNPTEILRRLVEVTGLQDVLRLEP